jgi:hypothetical protein
VVRRTNLRNKNQFVKLKIPHLKFDFSAIRAAVARFFSSKTGRGRQVLGVFLILVGFSALVTPFTPGSWLIFVGLEMFGIRVFFGRSVKEWIAHLRDKIRR